MYVFIFRYVVIGASFGNVAYLETISREIQEKRDAIALLQKASLLVCLCVCMCVCVQKKGDSKKKKSCPTNSV